MMGVIASEAKQSLLFSNEIATACKAGLAMTTPQISCDRALDAKLNQVATAIDSELSDSNWTAWKSALQTRLYRKRIE